MFRRFDGLIQTTGEMKHNDRLSKEDRRALLRYLVLTVVLFVPLLLAFAAIRNVYPFAAATMMTGLKESSIGRDYYVLRGETISGETIDLPAIKLTNALTGRNWTLVNVAVENKSFNIRYPHPANIRLSSEYGGIEKLPRAARLNDLLHSWGSVYNSRLPSSSSRRLKSIQLDAYRWDGGINGEYQRFVESWKALL